MGLLDEKGSEAVPRPRPVYIRTVPSPTPSSQSCLFGVALLLAP